MNPAAPPPDPDPDDHGVDDDVDMPDDSDAAPEIGDALRALLGPPGDVRDRAAAGVDRTLQGRSLVGTLTDLGSVGWQTLAHLLTNPTEPADRTDTDEDDR